MRKTDYSDWIRIWSLSYIWVGYSSNEGVLPPPGKYGNIEAPIDPATVGNIRSK